MSASVRLNWMGLSRIYLLAIAFVAVCSTDICSAQSRAADDVLARGRYLAVAADCEGCHTVDPAKPMAGGYAVPTPLGTIYAPNITPDKGTGIGDWTDDEFVQALHQGVGKNGENLYPAFPYDSYTLMSQVDVLAIKAYLFSLSPIHHVTPRNRLIFPFNQRWIISLWKFLNFQAVRFKPDSTKSDEWNRGGYLVQALGHCETCHTPRNLTMGLDRRRAFGGGYVGAWQAYNITADPVSGIERWSASDLFDYLSTGQKPGKAYAAGPMAEVVEHSLRFLTRPDLNGTVAYLRSRPPIHSSRDQKPRFAWGQPAMDDQAFRGADRITDSNRAISGAELYSGNCASCHGADGNGSADGYYPAMLHDSAVGASSPNNLVLVLLTGVEREGQGHVVFMPKFTQLDDERLANIANYVEQRFGNPTVKVTVQDVADFRRLGS